MNTFSTEDRTRTYQNLERTQSRFESGDAQFERELPPEIRAALFRSRPRSPRMAGNRSHTAAGRVSPPPPMPDEPDAAFAPPPSIPPAAKSAPGRGTARWWLAAVAGISMIVVISLAIGQLPKQVYFSPPIDSAPSPAAVEVRRALPIVEVRRALPRALRALPVNSVPSAVPTVGWQSIRMPDGSIIPIHYEGELPSSAALPLHGHFIGEEYSTGNTSWVWMTPAGTNVASWVDP